MAETKTVSIQLGGSILSLLGVLFVGLKLTHFIDWSWWWVTAPFWGPFMLILGIWAIIAIFFCLAFIFLGGQR